MHWPMQTPLCNAAVQNTWAYISIVEWEFLQEKDTADSLEGWEG
jgi:hypothetical protein